MQSNSSLNLVEFIKTGRRHSLPKGQIIQSSDLRMVVNYLEKGFVKRCQVLSKDATSIQTIYGPGDIFPLTLIYKEVLGQSIHDGQAIYQYQTMTRVTIYSVEARDISKKLEMTEAVYRDLLSQAGKGLERNITRLENLAKRTSSARIAHELLLLATQFGARWGDGIKILLPLTNQDLADVLNLTRETISMNLSDFRRQGLVGGGRYLTVLDIKKLSRIAEG